MAPAEHGAPAAPVDPGALVAPVVPGVPAGPAPVAAGVAVAPAGPAASPGPRTPKSPTPLSPTPEVAELQRACTAENMDRLLRMWLRDQLNLKIQIRNPKQLVPTAPDAWVDGPEPMYLNVCDYLMKK